MAERRAGQRSAAAAGHGAGGGDPGGAEQTPAVHVLHTQIRPGRASSGEENLPADDCVNVLERIDLKAQVQ